MKNHRFRKIIMIVPALAVMASMCLPAAADNSAQISCDLAVRKSGQTAFDTESDHVFKTAKGDSLEFQSDIDVSSLRDSIVIFTDDLLSAIKNNTPGIANDQAIAQAFNTIPTGFQASLNAVYTLPSGLTFGADAAKTVKITDANQAKIFSIDLTKTTVSGTQLTAAIQLNPSYGNKPCSEIIADLEKVSSHITLQFGGVLVGDDMKTGEVTCSITGSFAYTLPYSKGNWNVAEGWNGVQLASGKDYQHSLDTSFQNITLTLSTLAEVPAPSAPPAAVPSAAPLPSQDPLPSTVDGERPITPISSESESTENLAVTEEKDSTPNTGDAFAVWMWGILFAASLAVSAGVIKTVKVDQ